MPKIHDEKRNFHFVGNMAFTEDNVLVYNLFAYKVPRGLTNQAACDYFNRYGQVIYLNFFYARRNKRKGSHPKIGMIHFLCPVVAAMVLRKSLHTINDMPFYVKACDSWRQPHQCHGPNTTESVNGPWQRKRRLRGHRGHHHGQATADNKHQQKSKQLQATGGDGSILNVNDYCLEGIIRYLCLRDQVNFARTCKRFYGIFVMFSKVAHKSLSMADLQDMTLWDVREFLKAAGPFIKTLSGTPTYRQRDRVLSTMGRFATNLKCISFWSMRLPTRYLNQLIHNLKNLTQLTLTDCMLKDNSVSVVANLPKLETLNLSDNTDLLGRHLYKLSTVTELNLSGCMGLDNRFFVEMCKKLKKLKILNIKRINHLITSSYRRLAERLTAIETLKISCPLDEVYECVAAMPNLKRLDLLISPRFGRLRSQLLRELANQKADQLEVLKIIGKNNISYDQIQKILSLRRLRFIAFENNYILEDDKVKKLSELPALELLSLCNCPCISNATVLYILEQCPKLKSINLQGCVKIDNRFVWDAIKVMRKRSKDYDGGPLLVNVHQANINEEILLDNEYLQAKKFIRLYFDHHVDHLKYGLDGDIFEVDDDDAFDDIFIPGLLSSDEDDSDDSHNFNIELLGFNFRGGYRSDSDSDDDLHFNNILDGSDSDSSHGVVWLPRRHHNHH